jgi:hypothetical protein
VGGLERVVEKAPVQERKRKFTKINKEEDYNVCKERIREEDL